MAHSFKPGDRVVIVKSPRVPERIGQVATVVTDLIYTRDIFTKERALRHGLDLAPTHGAKIVAYKPSHLEPYRDDGSEPAEWTEELRKLCGRKETVKP